MLKYIQDYPHTSEIQMASTENFETEVANIQIKSRQLKTLLHKYV